MRSKILILFWFLGLAVYAQHEQLFQEANTAYKNENYTEALNKYHSILKEGYTSAELYYNMGNAYYKQNEIAPAIYYYEKALRLSPDFEDARVNLNIARRMTMDRIDSLPKSFFQRLAERMIFIYSSDTWAYGSVFWAILAAVLFLFYYFKADPAGKKALFISSMAAWFLFIVFTAFSISTYSHEKHNVYAIIFAKKTAIRAEPTPASQEIFELHEGTKVQVEEEDGNWCRIRLANGNTGWMPCEDFKIIGS